MEVFHCYIWSLHSLWKILRLSKKCVRSAQNPGKVARNMAFDEYANFGILYLKNSALTIFVFVIVWQERSLSKTKKQRWSNQSLYFPIFGGPIWAILYSKSIGSHLVVWPLIGWINEWVDQWILSWVLHSQIYW